MSQNIFLSLMKDTGNVEQVRKKMLELESSLDVMMYCFLNHVTHVVRVSVNLVPLLLLRP